MKRGDITARFDALLCADLHLRATVPLARSDKDRYFDAQRSKLGFIIETALRYDVPIIIAGDVGDIAFWPNWLLREVEEIILASDVQIYAVPGQHDLPGHNLDLLKKSGLGVLSVLPNMFVAKRQFSCQIGQQTRLFLFPFGTELRHAEVPKEKGERFIAVIHQMVPDDDPKRWELERGYSTARALLKRFSEYDLILSGDNHKTFVINESGRILVNPGPMMRMTTEFELFQPSVFLWSAGSNRVRQVHLPAESDVISLAHLREAKERKARMDDKTVQTFVEAAKKIHKDVGDAGKFRERLFQILRSKKEAMPNGLMSVINEVWHDVDAQRK